MLSNAKKFVSSRSKPTAVSTERVEDILWYVIECYCILRLDGPKYSKEWCKNSTTYKFEDYLKMTFVDDYLVMNKRLLQHKTTQLEQINFSYETSKRYTNEAGVEAIDKIDIYISKIGLQKQWSAPDDCIYFAIECKRIRKPKSYVEYSGDIQKFCSRSHLQIRLPFECMLGFVEEPNLRYAVLSKEITKELIKKRVDTTQQLTAYGLNSTFDGSYLSKHQRSFAPFAQFTLYHLFFDYSNIIVP